MTDGQDLLFCERGDVTRIVLQLTHIGGHRRLRDITRIILEGTHILRNLRNLRAVGQVVVVTTRCHGSQIRFTRQVVVRAAGSDRGQVGFVGQVIVVAVEARRQFHEAAARQVNGVVADGQNLRFGEGGPVREVVVITAGRYGGEVGDVAQVIVVAGESVGGLLREQGVGHAQQLLHTGDAVADAAVRINLRLQEIGAVGPVDMLEGAADGVTAANHHGHQTVGVSGRTVVFHIHGRSGFGAL